MSRYIKMKASGQGAFSYHTNTIHKKDEVYEVIDRDKDKNGNELPGHPGEGRTYTEIADYFIANNLAEEVNAKGEPDKKAKKKEEIENKAEIDKPKTENKMGK